MPVGTQPLGTQPLGTKTILREEPVLAKTGVQQYASISIPSTAKGVIEVQLMLDPVELLDTTFSLWFHLYEEMPDSSWRHVCGAKWQGGANSDPEFGSNFNPRFWFDSSRVAGRNIRIEIDDPQGKQVGFKLTSEE